MTSRRCFVISPIGKAGSPARNHADAVLSRIVRPAMVRCGVVARRADELLEPGRITDQMFREILQADFCIALLSGQNPNVFYELAAAQAAAKPVIILAQKDEDLPFDVKDMRCLHYDLEQARNDRGDEDKLVEFVASLERQDWKAEPLFQRFGRDLSTALPASYSFEPLASEVERTLTRLNEHEGALLLGYRQAGDADRMFDGLYSSILYASRAAISGTVDAIYYGNLMEFDAAGQRLRVRYFAGPYNDEIVTRSFPLTGPGQGVATFAFNQQKIQVFNSMQEELKVRGEARLNAMVCVPIPGAGDRATSRRIALLNVDSGKPDVFPTADSLRTDPAGRRLERLATMVARANVLYRWIVEAGPREEAPAIAPGALF